MSSEIVTIAGQQYRKATWPRRIAARLIDIVIVSGVCTIAGESLLLLTGPISICYLLLGNAVLRGRSVGKRLTGMRIINSKHGGPCSMMQDLIRHRYLFFTNPIFLLLTAYDSSEGYFDEPELYVVLTTPLTLTEREALREKPAKLDLEGMRTTLERIRNDGDNRANGPR